MRRISSQVLLLAAVSLSVPLFSAAQTLELYVDKKTKQVFTEAGPGREKLGTFAPVRQEEPRALSTSTSPAAGPLLDHPPAAVSADTQVASSEVKKKDWFEKLSVRGYMQFRYHSLFDGEGADWFHPADRSVTDDTTFLIRRARLILSGDVSEHVFLYVQPEFNAAPSDGDYSTQLRDFYGDIALDEEKEFRIRVGQSKVPYGFVNMQSSQNRGPLERPDAFNSAVEGERDLGMYLFWAPEEIRKRFRKLVNDGLKGSGDYGVAAIGAYSGQGLNRSDLNDEPHVVARLSYPFQFAGGQVFEPGVQAYAGRFVPRTRPFTAPGAEAESSPSFRSDGVADHRGGISAVLYPQPLGFEAEWNIGRGPELSEDLTTIDDESLNGGYLQANYKLDIDHYTFFPFVRWQYFDGGRKFGRNAPHERVNEWDFGLEFSPWKDVELTAVYTYTRDRTNTNTFPYDDRSNASRLGLQVQVNY